MESEKTRDDLRSEGKLDTASGEIDISSPEDKAASEGWEGRSPKRGKMPPSSGSGLEGDAVEQLHHEDKPSIEP